MRLLFLLAALLLFVTAPVPAQTFTVPVEYFKLDNGLKVVVSTGSLGAGGAGRGHLQHRLPRRAEGPHRLRAPVRAHDVPGFGQREEDAARLADAGGRRRRQRLDPLRLHQLLPVAAVERARTRAVPRGRPHAIARGDGREPEEPAERRQRGSARQRAQPAARRVRLDRNLGAGQHQLAQRPRLLRRSRASSRPRPSKTCAQFFKTYYAPNNAVLVVAGDATAADVKRLAEKHFGSIPRQPQPTPADLGEPPQTAPKSSTRTDALARTPAIAVAWHLPPRMSKDFFALSVLDPLLNSDDSARMYRKLVRDDRLAMSSSGGFNFLGPNWDMKGPMLYTMRVDYFNDKTADQVVAAIESRARRGEEERHHGGGARAGEDHDAVVVSRRHGRRRHAAVRARQPARGVRAVRRRSRRASTPSSASSTR